MIAKISNSKVFLVFLSIILAVILSVNATSNMAQNQGSNTPEGQSFTSNLVNVPINIQYDSTKYFISGYTSTASVTLTSYNQIELLQEKSPDMRSFKLVSDLTKLGVGSHKVPITVENLAKSINAKTDPATMTVMIENKDTKSIMISSVVDNSLIPEGYSLGRVWLSDYVVNVTAGTHSIKNIAKVEAILPSSTDLTQTVTTTVGLVAVDADGKIVPAKLAKSTVKMTIEIKKNATTSSSSSSSSGSSKSSSSS